MTTREQAAIQQAVEALEKLLPWALQAGANAEDALSALRALGDGWEEISTAKRDGTIVLLWVPGMPANEYGGHRQNFGYWDIDEFASKPKPYWKYDCYLGKSFERQNQPTNWQPLPVPPGGKR